MTRSEQAALIRRIEAEAKGDSRAIERHVIGLGALGYLFFASLLLALLGGAAAAGWIVVKGRMGALGTKLLIPIGVAIWACAKALFVPFPRVEGVPLARRDAPKLFALLDRLRGSLRTPRIHEVLMTMDVNASVNQRPRLGWFGWYRNTVAIGWPLMAGLSVGEFEAVMAHEMGHLSRSHGRLAAWGYRVRATFTRLAEQFEAQKSALNAPVQAFIEWWWPKLSAHTFVLSRRQELEADRAAGMLAGSQNLVTALLRLAAIDESLSRFWPAIYTQAAAGQPIPGDTVERLAGFVTQVDAALVAGRLRAVACETTGFEDTHPALADRAAALGVPVAGEPVLAPIAESAGTHYLAPGGDEVRGRLQASWESAAASHWAAFGDFLRTRAVRLAELEARPAVSLTTDEAWERCELLQVLDRDGEAVAAGVGVLERDPDRVPALLYVGRVRLKKGDERGVQDLLRAAELSAEVRGPALAELVAHHRRSRREAQASELEARLLSHEDQLQAASKERSYEESDVLEPHRLGKDEVTALVAALRAAAPELIEIRVARKRLRLFPETPVHVIGFKVRTPWYRQSATIARNTLAKLGGTPLPCAAYLVGLDASRVAASRFADVEDTLVYSE